MKHSEEYILHQLKIDEEIFNIYQYGSRVYGNEMSNSDYDYLIVAKSYYLKNGGFKQNAISNEDKTIQGILYSRTGFLDAINNYDISALECLFLPEDFIVKKTINFKINRWNEAEFVKKIISKVSMSWYSANNFAKDENKYMAKKGIYHSFRILMFAEQLKQNNKISDYSISNKLKEEIFSIEDEDFDTRDYIKKRDEFFKKLRS